MNRLNQNGMSLPVVMILLLVMTIIGLGMHRLVQSAITVNAGFQKRAIARAGATAAAALVMETLANSVTGGTLAVAQGLTIQSATIQDLYGAEGNDNITDSPDSSWDFEAQIDTVRARIDVDFLTAIPIAGGSIEFASAYDGVGAGQTLGSGFIISELIHIQAVDLATGGRAEIRFQADY